MSHRRTPMEMSAYMQARRRKFDHAVLRRIIDLWWCRRKKRSKKWPHGYVIQG